MSVCVRKLIKEIKACEYKPCTTKIKSSHRKYINKNDKHVSFPYNSKGVNRMLVRRILKEIGSPNWNKY